MSERKPGFYWVKIDDDLGWECAFWDDLSQAFLTFEFGAMPESKMTLIGPRIPTPDEPWQCVPVEATPEMLKHGFIETQYDEGRGNRMEVYRAMLAAAPKPENS